MKDPEKVLTLSYDFFSVTFFFSWIQKDVLGKYSAGASPSPDQARADVLQLEGLPQ